MATSNELRSHLTSPDGLATRLKAARLDAGLKAIDLAARAGWVQPKVSKIENGRQLPTIADVKTWARICRTPAADRTELLELLREVRSADQTTLRIESLLRTFRKSAFRLEQARVSPTAVAGGELTPWLAGADPVTADEGWLDAVRLHISAGRQIARLRVDEEPPTPYQQWRALSTPPLVDAGEVHRRLSRSNADRLGIDHSSGDWWLIDTEVLIRYTISNDWEPIIDITNDRRAIEEAVEMWEIGWEASSASEREPTRPKSRKRRRSRNDPPPDDRKLSKTQQMLRGEIEDRIRNYKGKPGDPLYDEVVDVQKREEET